MKSKKLYFYKEGNFDLFKEIIKSNPYLIKVWNNLGLSSRKPLLRGDGLNQKFKIL